MRHAPRQSLISAARAFLARTLPAQNRAVPTLRLLSLLLLLTAAPPAAAAGSPQDAVSAYLGTWNTGDLSQLGAVVSDDFQRHARPGESPASPQELADLVRRIRGNFEQVRIEMDEILCEGPRCALTGHFVGRIPGTDRGVRMLMTAFYRTEAGRVAEEWVVANQLPSMLGLGYHVASPGTQVVSYTESGEKVVTTVPEQRRPGSAAPPDADAAPPDPSAAEGPVHRLVRAYLDVWASGDVAALDGLVTDDFQRSDWNGHVESRDELAVRIGQDRAAIDDLRWQVQDLLVEGDLAAARLVQRGTWHDTGDVLVVPVHALYHVEDGRLASEFPLGDHVAFLEALGCRVTKPGEELIPPPIDEPPPPAFDEAAAVRALDAAAADLAAEAPSGRAAATVAVTSRTLGHLSVDGHQLGVTVPGHRVELRLRHGPHVLALRSLGGRPLAAHTVDLARGERLDVELGPTGRLLADLANRVSEDLHSGLLWTLVDNGEDLTWAEAVAYCDELDLAGFDDWRLPDVRQLLPLYDPDSSKDWRTLPGVELSSCCPWSINRRGAMAWAFVSYKGGAYLRYPSFQRYQRAVCTRQLW